MKIKTTNYTSIRMGNSVFKVPAPNAGGDEEKSDFSHSNIKKLYRHYGKQLDVFLKS